MTDSPAADRRWFPLLPVPDLSEQIRQMQDIVRQVSHVPIFPKTFAYPDYPHVAHPLRKPTLGHRIIETDLLTVPAEDWSQVRSPSRARRRLKRGYRQNIRYYHKPDTTVLATEEGLVMHPEMARRLRERLLEQQDKVALNALCGRISL